MSKSEIDVDEALDRLEEINTRLTEEKLPLSESIALYKEGVELADKAREQLEGVEQELRVVNGDHKPTE